MTRKSGNGNGDNPLLTPIKRLVAPIGTDAATRKVFKRVVGSKPATFFESSDLEPLVEYCSIKAEIDEYKKVLEKEGRFLTDAKGITRPHPGVAALNGARNALIAYSTKLKLNPRARGNGLTKEKVHREAAKAEAVQRSGVRRPGLMFVNDAKSKRKA